MNTRKILFVNTVLLLFLGVSNLKAQVIEAEKGEDTKLQNQNDLLEWLVGEQPAVNTNSKINLLGNWEALAYVDLERTPALEEAVPDRYTFQQNGNYSIQFYQQAPEEPQLSAEGKFEIKEGTLLLYLNDFPNVVFQEMLIWFVSEDYLVLEMDQLRIFFTRPKGTGGQ